MSAETTTQPSPTKPRSALVGVAVALLAALLAGVAMSFGQTFAPPALASLFNSAAPVVALAALVALAGRRAMGHVALGAAAGPLAMVGYYATTSLRDFPVSMRMVLFWSVAGIVSGAAAGLAVWLLRGNGAPVLRGAAAGVLPATALGEAAHGLLRIADTTSPVYWWTQAALGAAVLLWTMRRLDTWPERGIAVAATAVLAVSLFLVYGAF